MHDVGAVDDNVNLPEHQQSQGQYVAMDQYHFGHGIPISCRHEYILFCGNPLAVECLMD